MKQVDKPKKLQHFVEVVIPLTNRLSELQREDGAISAEGGHVAERLLYELRAAATCDASALTRAQREAFALDVDNWIGRGATTAPSFHHMRDATEAPRDRDRAAFIGPVHLPNSGFRWPRLQAFLVERLEPDSAPLLNERFPHPHNMCQSTKLLAGTRGVSEGDCVVFFPENILSSEPLGRQRYSWFFFNKHRTIYGKTLGVVRSLGIDSFPTSDRSLASGHLDENDAYQARCVWGYLHDYFHHLGARPFNLHLALKTQWHTGVLEELKVDSQAAVAAVTSGIPYGEIVYEYVLLERLFRYPVEPDAPDNSDSASGVLLARWLTDAGAMTVEHDKVTFGSKEEVINSLCGLVAQIEALEALPDGGYLRAADRWIRGRLGSPPPDRRYAVPGDLAESQLWPTCCEV